jgi:hypothetical protein
LQAEDEQEEADGEPEAADRDHRERRPEGGDDRRERENCGAHAGQGGTPAARYPCGEDDRERFDHLDRAREECRGDEEGGAHGRTCDNASRRACIARETLAAT